MEEATPPPPTTTAAADAPTKAPQKKLRRRYLLARHGETNFNKERRVQGTSDASVLTLEGISQASALGVYFTRRQAGEALDNVDDRSAAVAPSITRTWCSPLTRCRQTYAAISGCCKQYNCPPLPTPTIDDNLREIELCEWQGRLRQEIIEEDSENWKVFKSDPKRLRLKNGTFAPVMDCWERGEMNWNDIRKDAAKRKSDESTNDNNKEQGGAIFIMCHGAIGQCMLLQALGIPIDAYGKSRKYSFDNCECVEIEWADDDDTASDSNECAIRWRRVHPVESQWQSASASRQMASGGLSCGR